MLFRKTLYGAALLAGAATTLPIQANQEVFSDVIVVTARRDITRTELISGDESPPMTPDAAAMISRLPGAALIRNGGLSGQVQFRGAYGFRVGARVNGQAFHPGGPNLMDPPMHYAPPTLVETIEVSRGASPVAFGPSLIGGVDARLKQVGFAETANYQPQLDVTVIGRSADRSHALGVLAGTASDTVRVFGFYSTEEGDELRSPDGDIDNTFHEREVYGAGFGWQAGESTWDIEVRRQETGPTGNPPFAMDIDFVETDFLNLGYSRTIGETEVSVRVGYSDVDHGMNNFAWRPPPASMMRYRYNLTMAETRTLEFAFSTPFDKGDLTYGVDLDRAEMGARITNPGNGAFHVDPLPGIDQERTGAYVSWRQSLAGGDIDLGIRVDRHESDTDAATTGTALPAGPVMLAMQFNQAERKWSDTTVDALARYWVTTDSGTWRLSLARKTRAPTHLERYGWLPIAASAGLADGNNYVGTLDLDPETAWIAEAGVDLSGPRWWVRPTLFFHQVDDYIQGTSFDETPGTVDSMVEMVSMMNGDMTPLRFSNVDARMFGVDADFGYQLSAAWRVEGVLSVVRGERRDVSDDLYRISPDKLSLGLVYDRGDWTVTLEGIAVDGQDHVSDTNSEQETGGYGLFNLYGSWQVSEQVDISGGIENLGDREYRDHLSGYNRVMNSDVNLGERLPGVGRNVFLRLSYRR